MLGRKRLIIFLFLIFLVACNNSQREQGRSDSNRFINLSTNNQEENTEQPLNSPLNELIEEQEQPNDREKDDQPEEKVQNDQNLEEQQKALPAEPVPPEEIYNINPDATEQFEVDLTLPFNNFKERWNAISEANYSNLYIKQFREHQNDDGMTHTAALNEQIELRVHTSGNYVQSIELVTKGNGNIFLMLTGWSQVVNILHPELEIHDVDAFFNKLGIGPNGDLSNLKVGTYPYGHISYTMSRLENGYSFQGTYQ